ncbi:MAG: hypothetical protein NTU54_00045 [Candidatus Omnitrophica bacterium]|nr:hypothetical protein [Candidatus Omnitrophota bacterium]
MRIIKKINEKLFCSLRSLALKKASDEQGLTELRKRLETLVPDITDHYSAFKIDDPYLMLKVRNLHAFQVSLVQKVINGLKKWVIVDIGDSSGAHLKYLKTLYSDLADLKCLSVNLDQKAVDRIKARGLEAIKARAEELDKYNIHPDLFLCFETLEHLFDPVRFLYELSNKTDARFLIVTVPYLRQSRVGLDHIRENRYENVIAENTHIYELCPGDWKLIMRQSGWDIVYEQIYSQHPHKGILKFTKYLWKKYDYEGFYGAILKRDHTWSSKYADW